MLQSYPALCDPMDSSHARLLYPWDSPGKKTRVGSHALLQGIFLTQGSNLHLLSLLYWKAGSLTLPAFLNTQIEATAPSRCWHLPHCVVIAFSNVCLSPTFPHLPPPPSPLSGYMHATNPHKERQVLLTLWFWMLPRFLFLPFICLQCLKHEEKHFLFKCGYRYKGGFLGGSAVKNPPANAGDTRDVGLIPGSGRYPGVGNGNPL